MGLVSLIGLAACPGGLSGDYRIVEGISGWPQLSFRGSEVTMSMMTGHTLTGRYSLSGDTVTTTVDNATMMTMRRENDCLITHQPFAAIYCKA